MFVVDARWNKCNISWMQYILAAAHSLQAAAGTSVVGLGMLAELQGKGLYTSSLFGLNTSEQLSQMPLHSSKTTASAETLLEEQFIHKPSTSGNLPNAPHKVTMLAGLYDCKTRDHREQKPEKLFHLLALRITICLTLYDGSQEETLLKGKERRKKGQNRTNLPSSILLPCWAVMPSTFGNMQLHYLKRVRSASLSGASLLSSDISQALIYSDLCPAGITTSRRTVSAPVPPCVWSYSVALEISGIKCKYSRKSQDNVAPYLQSSSRRCWFPLFWVLVLLYLMNIYIITY